VLSEFRKRLVDGNAAHLLFDTLLTQCRAHGLLRARGRQRSDSTHVLAAVRALNRLECVGATMRHALNSLAVVVPDWLLAHSHPDWLERYGPRMEDYRLPKNKDERVAFATVIGADGVTLLQAITATDAPDWLRTIPAVQTLRQVWIQNLPGVIMSGCAGALTTRFRHQRSILARPTTLRLAIVRSAVRRGSATKSI